MKLRSMTDGTYVRTEGWTDVKVEKVGYSIIIGTTSLVQFSRPGFLQQKLSSNWNQMVQDNELVFLILPNHSNLT